MYTSTLISANKMALKSKPVLTQKYDPLKTVKDVVLLEFEPYVNPTSQVHFFTKIPVFTGK